MRIEGEVLQAPVLDPETGDETQCAISLLVMDAAVSERGGAGCQRNERPGTGHGEVTEGTAAA